LALKGKVFFSRHTFNTQTLDAIGSKIWPNNTVRTYTLAKQSLLTKSVLPQ